MTSALQTLYGSSEQSQTKLAGNIGGQGREAETWTPDWLIEVSRQAMGSIHLDPCGASKFDSTVTLKATKNRKERVNPITGGWFADVTLVKPGTFEGLAQSPHGGTVVCLDGLSQDWSQAASVFVNPPYADLEAWLQKCAETAVYGTPVVCLGPFRPHRTWFPRLLRKAEIVSLWYRVMFKGHVDACPFPLFLAAWNCEIPALGDRETGRWLLRETATRGSYDSRLL